MRTEKQINQLKICMVVHQNYFTDARVRRYAESLTLDGAKVDIICVSVDGEDVSQTVKGINIYPIPIGRGYRSQMNYLLEYFVAFFFYFFMVSFLHLKHHYDVIHIHNMPDFLVFSALLPRLMGTPVILDVHDIMPEFYMSKFNRGADDLIVRAISFQEIVSTKFASSLITVCRGARECLQKRGVKKDDVLIIYNTPNPKIFDRKKYSEVRSRARENFTLIFPGTHAPRYGLDIPIRALPLLIPKIKNLKLQIVGRQVEYTRELANLARELNVDRYVEFIPSVPLDEVPALMAAADVGIYPAIKEAYMDLAVPEKVFEFAMMGLPVVATRLNVLQELFSNQALLFFESGQIEQFAENVLKLYENPDLAKSMVNQADLEYQKGFSWEIGKRDYYHLLEQLVRK